MELAVFVGLQGSGKSTFYRERLAATHAHVSKDLFRNNRNPARRQARLVEEVLAAEGSVAVDNTNPSVEDRHPLVEAGGRHGAEVNAYHFDSPLPACLERNRSRAGKARVPDVALFATSRRLQIPTFSEGFDRIFIVHPAGEHEFEVRERGREEA